jgi:hypothetical protein
MAVSRGENRGVAPFCQSIFERIYQMLTKPDKQILILDEPEQGSDPEVAVRVIGNIFKSSPSLTTSIFLSASIVSDTLISTSSLLTKLQFRQAAAFFLPGSNNEPHLGQNIICTPLTSFKFNLP